MNSDTHDWSVLQHPLCLWTKPCRDSLTRKMPIQPCTGIRSKIPSIFNFRRTPSCAWWKQRRGKLVIEPFTVIVNIWLKERFMDAYYPTPGIGSLSIINHLGLNHSTVLPWTCWTVFPIPRTTHVLQCLCDSALPQRKQRYTYNCCTKIQGCPYCS